ncbi:MAG: trypsin-like peptidase domain-containing protein [Myxococcaceae bacterium]|nr:trypsin-like peptidase domain-containing protein [Myxococcaceae bacterium]
MKERASIARIDVARAGAPPARGTGALVADDLVLTALHVVANREQNPPAFFQGPISLTFPGKTVKAVPVDGMWDGKEDWVLLRCLEPPGIPPLPLGELETHEQGLEWSTFGFPDANPVDGLVAAGEVRNSEGSYRGIPAIQLFSDEAAAGDGAPVAGLSGAPCLVEGAVVGVIRSSLLRQGGLNVAGTVYACPTRFVLDKANGLLPLPDPCRGLPGLPRCDLPSNPYRSLKRYTEADAEIFFGRSADIRSLYLQLVDPEGAAITLLFGQSGVGKSSLLDAGLMPRLHSFFIIRYVRRDAARGLRACLEEATSGNWLALEAREGRPALIILDQVEEAFTRPSGDPRQELSGLMESLEALFGPQAKRPRGRLILAFRKEWLAEIRTRLLERGLSFFEHFLRRLGSEKPEEIIEVVHGLTRTERMRRHYRAHIDPDLGRVIADDLLEDPGSPVAPTLQILMTRLWEHAREESPGAPKLTRARYLALKQKGLHLVDFLRQALAQLPKEVQPQVSSGLVDDVLEAHTTVLGTADTRTRGELDERYRTLPPEALDRLLRALEQQYLLTNPDKDPMVRDKDRTRLSHDTLAPLVRERFRTSTLPGQRARRVLEARTAERTDGQPGRTLDRFDLRLVEQGQAGMRAPTESERRLIQSSQLARRLGILGRALGVLAVLSVVGVLLWLYTGRVEAQALSANIKSQKLQTEARRYFDLSYSIQEPTEALKYISRAVEVAPEDDPQLGLYIARTLHLFTQVAPARLRVSTLPVKSAELSQGWSRLILQNIDNEVTIVEIDTRDAIGGVQVISEKPLPIDGSRLKYTPRLSPDGRWVVTVTTRSNEDDVGWLQVWDTETSSVVFESLVPSLGGTAGFSFTPDSRAVLHFKWAAGDSVAARLGDTWEAGKSEKTWELRRRFMHGSLPQLDIEIIPQGKWNQIRILDIVSGQPVFQSGQPLRIRGHSYLLSPFGSAIATESTERYKYWIYTWNSRTGERIARVHKPGVGANESYRADLLAVSDDGRHLVLANHNDFKQVANDVTVVKAIGELSKVMRTHLSCQSNAPLGATLFSTERDRFRNGFALACADEHRFRMWVESSPQPTTRSVDIQDILAGQPTLEEGRLATISSTCWLEIHPLFKKATEHRLQRPLLEKSAEGGSGVFVKAARFSGDGSQLVTLETADSGSEAGSHIAVRESPDWRVLWHQPVPSEVKDFVMTSGAERIATFSSADTMGIESITLWDTRTQRPPRSIPDMIPGSAFTFGVGFEEPGGKLAVGRGLWAPGVKQARPETVGLGLWAPGVRQHQPQAASLRIERFDFDKMEASDPLVVPKKADGVAELPRGFAGGSRYIVFRPSKSLFDREDAEDLSFLLMDARTGLLHELPRSDKGISVPLIKTLLDMPGGLRVETDGSRVVSLFQGEKGGGVWTNAVINYGQMEMKAVSTDTSVPFVLSNRRASGVSAYCAAGPWFAYVDKTNSTLHIESLAAGTELVAFDHPPVRAIHFSADCNRLMTVSEDGVVRDWFVSHPYTKKPEWVADLGALVTASRLGGEDNPRPANLLNGPGRAEFIRTLKREASQGDAGAQYVLDHIQSASAP